MLIPGRHSQVFVAVKLGDRVYVGIESTQADDFTSAHSRTAG
jgi:hypothetical protein